MRGKGRVCLAKSGEANNEGANTQRTKTNLDIAPGRAPVPLWRAFRGWPAPRHPPGNFHVTNSPVGLNANGCLKCWPRFKVPNELSCLTNSGSGVALVNALNAQRIVYPL